MPEGPAGILDPMNLLTFGLLVFAGVQVWVTHKAERARLAERAADEQARTEAEAKEVDLAFQTVWAEHFRLDALAASYAKADLLQMSLTGILRPEDVLPRDWATQTRMLARLGAEAGYLGGVAITLAHDLARDIHEFNQSIADLFDRNDERAIGLKVASIRTTGRGSRLAMYEERIRGQCRELATLTWDAASHSPRGDIVRTLTFRDDLASEVARKAARALVERGI